MSGKVQMFKKISDFILQEQNIQNGIFYGGQRKAHVLKV